VFALAGNDPSKDLANCPKSKHGIKRQGAAIVVNDHGAFITEVYKGHGTKS
jgi:hypothetical protein